MQHWAYTDITYCVGEISAKWLHGSLYYTNYCNEDNITSFNMPLRLSLGLIEKCVRIMLS